MPETFNHHCATTLPSNDSIVPLSSNSDSPGLTPNVAAEDESTTTEGEGELTAAIGIEGTKSSPQANGIEYAQHYWAHHLYLAVKDAEENWLELGNIQLPTPSKALRQKCGAYADVLRCMCHAGWALMKFNDNRGEIPQLQNVLGQLQHLIDMRMVCGTNKYEDIELLLLIEF
ncbi:hypothetical protein BU17DRAFT_84381 [Hysterangium stoloniferum]|nr:hypothetical protein BU17DRAFT_84381 [Hysterangium stoloniferum]